MNKKLYVIAAVSLLAGLLIGAANVFNDVPLGSVVRGNEYRSTNVTSLTASGTSATILKSGSSVLGSVVFSTTSAQSVTLYNVLGGVNYGSTTLSTKIADFATGTPAGTYTYDVSVSRGLGVYMPVLSTKDIVITYR